MNRVVLLDSSIFIDLLRSGRHEEKINDIDGLLRTSSVVLAELWRGAKKQQERDFFNRLEKNHPILTPTAKHWLESGQILAKMNMDYGFNAEKLRDLHFDVLIALTTRAYGATLITSNRSDFELIRTYREFELEIW